MTATPDSFSTPQHRQLASELAQLRPAAVDAIRPQTMFYQAGFAAAQAEFAANDRRRRRGALALAVCVAAAVTIPVSFYAGQTSVLSTTTARIDSPPPAAETESHEARINAVKKPTTAQPATTPRSTAPLLATDDTPASPSTDATTGPYQAVFADWLQRLAHSTSPPWDETAPIASPTATSLVAFHRGGVIDVSNPHWSEALWTSTLALYRNPAGTQADQQATGQTRSLAVGDLNQLAETYRIAQ